MMTESEIIKRISEKFQLQTSKNGFGPFGDDGFTIPSGAAQDHIVLSTDSFCEGTHFNPEMGYSFVGWKSLVSALSDVFSMGASPSFYSLNLIVPKTLTNEQLEDFLDGLHKATLYYKVNLLGGDVARGNSFNVCLQVGGYQPDSLVKRNIGAQKGDVILTDQYLGRALLGFEAISKNKEKDPQFTEYVKHFKYPKPDSSLGVWLTHWEEVTTLTDISDGLFKELSHLSFNQQAQIELSEIPTNKEFTKACQTLSLESEKIFLKGGEDYSLMWTLKTEVLNDFLKAYQIKFKKRPYILGRVRSINNSKPMAHPLVYENQKLIESIKPFEHF